MRISEMPVRADVLDTSSAANYSEYAATHLNLSLTCDFPTQKLNGFAEITFQPLRGGPAIMLDVLDLEIFSVTLQSQPLQFVIHDFAEYGKALRITLPSDFVPSEVFTVRINYAAGPGPGLSWLEPQQTAGKKHPFLFTQGQASTNRSLFPCQVCVVGRLEIHH